ncbi:hypothetical protein [Shimia biformata]|uniref:hypothetical protein n=1 Tax=Shimia biformata TaxID=1294299 RepID=UPI00194DB684|nr:hypothetical protein [Shimia biformata]
MKMTTILGLAVALSIGCIGGDVSAQDWHEPQRGTETRKDLMDAMRAHAEWQLGAPIQFVVEDLRVAGDIAYAALVAQRPGGGAIDLAATPAAAQGRLDPEFLDGTWYNAFYRKVGRTWVAIDWTLGATDAWWAEPVMCAAFEPVIPEFCAMVE